jgi:hypothetical protein
VTNSQEKQLKEGKVYFGSHFQEFQFMNSVGSMAKQKPGKRAQK